MLDADFEYGLQPTKWQAISLMRNYPSVYEIPNSDQPVISVTTDASTGTSGIGSSLITVTTQNSHGLAAGSLFTIKALAVSVSGFNRAEGSFLVNTVPSATTFTYYAKSKVGTTNGEQLAASYTQLRSALYYTGASIANPLFSVYSNGGSGTITTSLFTASNSNFIGFTGVAPPNGAPLSGTGLPTGAQITAVTGSGGIVTSTTLTVPAEIGATSITVDTTTGITAGLVIDRGDGQSVLVTSVVGNTISISGALTSAIAGGSQTYTGIPATGGTGSGAQFAIARAGGSYYVSSIIAPGTGYQSGDTLTINGTSLGGSTPANNASIIVTSASDVNSVSGFDNLTLVGGTGFTVIGIPEGTVISSIGTTGGTGTGLTVSITIVGDSVTAISVVYGGHGYTLGDTITVAGGDNNCTIVINAINAGGFIQAVTVSGTPVTVPTVSFISAFTLNTFTTASIANGSSGISYSAIPTIQVSFSSPHGFVPGNTITTVITSNGTGAQLAAGAFFIEQVPTSTTLLYTARSAGSISNTLTGSLYARPDGYFIHRPYDGGVQLGTGGPSHGASAIRMSKKYIRYQSGKGVMYNTGALFAPNYNIASLTATGTAVGSIITVTTDDTDHGCQVGGEITISGISSSGYNGNYTVFSILTERMFTIVAQLPLSTTNAVLSANAIMSIRSWHGATVRAGIFDDQNGMFWQYDGLRLAVVKRSSTFQLAGSVSIPVNGNIVSGSGTRFTSQLAAGDRIVLKGMSHVVTQIISDTSLTVAPDYRGVVDVTQGKITKTVDLIIPQSNWNIDPLNGTGQSGYNIDVTKMQMIGIQHTWYGAGFIDFMLRGSDGNYIWAHRFRNSNVNTEAYMRSGNQPVRYEVINEGAKGVLSAAISTVDTTIPLVDAYWFPNFGTVMIDSELISYTGNSGTALTGCTRAASITQFAAGAQRTFSGSTASTHAIGIGVILVSCTITPIISHWGSAYMIDGQFDSDRGYIFNYNATGISASTTTSTTFLIRLAPSVSNAQTGDLGVRELLNRAQMLLESISVTSDSVSGGGAIVIQGVLNPINYPSDPNLITWTGLNTAAAGGQPSFAQIALGGSVSWGGNVSTTTATIQGAFTTTLTAKSFSASSTTLTAVSFSTVQQTITAASFSFSTSSTYNSALNSTRNDFLMTNSSYDALITPLIVGDVLSVGTYLTSNQTVSSITRGYITLNGTGYTRIVMSSNANATSTPAASNNSQNVSITLTNSAASRYASAISTGRTDFLVTQSSIASSTAALTDILSVSTYVTGSQTISSITQNYVSILGTSYARVVMSSVGNATSSTGNGNNISITATSAATATYGSALSTSRNDFLITDTAYDASGIASSDALSLSTYLTGGQTITNITRSYVTIGGVNHTRITMSGVANSTTTSGSGNDATITVTASGTGASYNSTNYVFFTSASWASSGATIGTKVAASFTAFPAGTSVAAVATRTFGATTIYRISFTQSLNTTVNAAGTVTFQFGASYGLPGEQVFSFVNNPGSTDTLQLTSLKEMTATALGGRGTFPNGPDVLAINVYKVSGTATNVNLTLRWSEAQA
jgi:hypothetical protein